MITAATYIWILVCAFLVFIMQAGFICLEAGFTRSKNTCNAIMKGIMDFCMGTIGFWIFGFALMFGGSGIALDGYTLPGIDAGNKLFGTSGFFLTGADNGTYLFWVFQVMFCAAGATIVAGGVAERMKFPAYLVTSFAISAFIYPVFGHWVWGGGWLASVGDLLGMPGKGVWDFAGSSVVHAIGGWLALAGAMALGPREGKYDAEGGRPQAIPGHSMSLGAVGLFILWFGWFGFNPGSTVNGNDGQIALIAMNTNMAAVTGAIAAVLVVYFLTKKFDLSMCINGALAGLVAITAPCAFVSPAAAFVIGAMGGVLVVMSTFFIENRGIDDPIGAFSVHGVNGVWGTLAVGIFSNGTYNGVTGFLHGDFQQLIVQAIACVIAVVWAFGCGTILFSILRVTLGIRVSLKEEIEGEDLGTHGAQAYPEFVTEKLTIMNK